MTDELHNHIAEMVCETDEPGKPADVTGDLIRRADALKAIDPGDGDFHLGNYMAISALPAVQVDAAQIRAEALREAAAVCAAAAVDMKAQFNKGRKMPDYSIDVMRQDRLANRNLQAELLEAAILALIPTPDPSPDVGALLMVENIDTISDLCRKHKVKEPSFRAILRALAAQEGGE